MLIHSIHRERTSRISAPIVKGDEKDLNTDRQTYDGKTFGKETTVIISGA